MTGACHRIGELVTRIQETYLDSPGLALTLGKAQRRFRLDAVTCRALFDLFLETGVLTAGRDGFRLRQAGRAARAEGRIPREGAGRGPRRGARLSAAA